jgi:putative hydrolases of HD superfamily
MSYQSMQIHQTDAAVRPSVTTQAVIDLGRLCLAFGRVDRITYHPDGVTRESDTDHTVMLGLTACAFASALVPRLDVGLIAQYALVHDLVEVHAGDTPTLRITADGKAAKAQREREALNRIHAEYIGTLPWLPELIDEYECLVTPEARFVKALDKLLPKITHLLNGAVTIREQGMSRDELAARYETQVDELMVYAADFPELFALRAELVALVMARIDNEQLLAEAVA